LCYDGFQKRRASFNRRNIFARDGNRCQYCGKVLPTSELSIDHVIPVSRGGTACWENVVCACTECNKLKGSRLPREAGMKLIRKPYAPKADPLIKMKIKRKKYHSWRQFLGDAYWSVPLEQ
jgi:5-methylcytosine-specific restriction endonuclease McrA